MRRHALPPPPRLPFAHPVSAVIQGAIQGPPDVAKQWASQAEQAQPGASPSAQRALIAHLKTITSVSEVTQTYEL